MLNFFKGKKTYIIAVLIGVVNMLYYNGSIDKATYDMLMGLLGAGVISTVAAKVNRIEKKVE